MSMADLVVPEGVEDERPSTRWKWRLAREHSHILRRIQKWSQPTQC